MTKKEISKGNMIIAEFMGISTFSDKSINWCYNFSWDALMPVVEKIENLEPHGYRFTISSTFVRVHTCKNGSGDSDEYNCTVFEGKLKCTWYAVVEFIKWYNTLKK